MENYGWPAALVTVVALICLTIFFSLCTLAVSNSCPGGTAFDANRITCEAVELPE